MLSSDNLGLRSPGRPLALPLHSLGWAHARESDGPGPGVHRIGARLDSGVSSHLRLLGLRDHVHEFPRLVAILKVVNATSRLGAAPSR